MVHEPAGDRPRHGRRTRQRAGVRHRPSAGRLDGDFGQERWRDAGVHRARFRRAGLVHQVRPARLSGHGDRHGGARRQALLGAGLSRAGDAPGDAAARGIDDRRPGPHHIAERQPASLQGIGYPAAAAQSAPRRPMDRTGSSPAGPSKGGRSAVSGSTARGPTIPTM